MRDAQQLKAESRTGTGKGPAYQARLKGLIPAVIYGGEDAPQNITVDFRTIERHVGAGAFLTSVFDLDVAGKKTRVIPRQLQLDPVSDRPVHVDFLRLIKGTTVRLPIPVQFKGQGESPGLKRGGVLNIVRHDMEMICPAENIPDVIEVDISGLNINETIHVSQLKLPEGVRPVVRRDFTIASVVAPSSAVEELKTATATEAAPAEGAAPAAGAAAPAAAAGAKAPAAPAKK